MILSFRSPVHLAIDYECREIVLDSIAKATT